jgi:hypothetical protein
LGLLLRECQVDKIKRDSKTFYSRAIDVQR